MLQVFSGNAGSFQFFIATNKRFWIYQMKMGWEESENETLKNSNQPGLIKAIAFYCKNLHSCLFLKRKYLFEWGKSHFYPIKGNQLLTIYLMKGRSVYLTHQRYPNKKASYDMKLIL